MKIKIINNNNKIINNNNKKNKKIFHKGYIVSLSTTGFGKFYLFIFY
jgi:hypothetical protein